MTHSGRPSGNSEPSFPRFLPHQDALDQAIEEILGKENPTAYSVFTAVERIIRQFKLDMEAHALLFEAYLRGKKTLHSGTAIRNPQAWLRGTAYNIAREKSRKRQRSLAYSPDLIEALIPCDADGPLDKAILEEEIQAAFKAAKRLQSEKPDIFLLIHQRVVEELSWQEIQANYAKSGETISEATLRQRFSRGRKYLRLIFHEVS